MSEPIKTNSASPNTSVASGAAEVKAAPAPAATTVVDPKAVVELLERVTKLEAEKAQAAKEAEAAANVAPAIDWTTVKESDIFDLEFPLEVIETEEPQYMNIYLRDNNYVPRWIHRLDSHLGSKLASGWEYITEKDWDANHPMVLRFNSEGHLCYEDVIALKCHKSRYFSALKRTQARAMQIKGVNGYNKVAGRVKTAIENNPQLHNAVSRGAISFYGENVESAVESINL